MKLVISESIRAKMQAKHGVSPKDVQECFLNRTGGFLEDIREQHRTDPPTRWFLAFNNHQRLLKVCFVFRHGQFFIRTCYEPSAIEIDIYTREGEPNDP